MNKYAEDSTRKGFEEAPMREKALTKNELDKLEKDTFGYFLKETNPENGLVPDNTRTGSHCSIAAVGLALSCYTVAA